MNLKTVILNGHLKGDSSLDLLTKVVLGELKVLDSDVEEFELCKINIAPCTGCFGCWIKTPGICIIDDASRDITKAVIQSDLLIALTPVTFGGYSSELKKVLDRIIGLISPFFKKINGEVHHKPRYETFPKFLALGVQKKMDEDSANIFNTLASRNAINMQTPHVSGVLTVNSSNDEVKNNILDLFKALEVT